MEAPEPMRIIRVFPRRTNMTPSDELAFVGDPPLFRPEADEVHVSCTFTWDLDEARRLQDSWSRFYPTVRLGGPALDDPGGEFTPGLYLAEGATITSRGCPKRCEWCWVPVREGKIRLLEIHPGNNICDNNLLACPRFHVEQVFKMLESQHGIRFTGGLDTLLLADWHIAWFMVNLRRTKAMFFAADDWRGVNRLDAVADTLAGIPRDKKFCYVLVGHKGETIPEAEDRLETVWELGFMPFAQFYRGPDEQPKTPAWQKLARNWSRPALIKALHR
jgi:hypothetical protein